MYSEQLEPPKSRTIALLKTAPAKSVLRTRSPAAQSSSPARVRGIKRSRWVITYNHIEEAKLTMTSNEMATGSDKENVQVDIDMPKKRTKTIATSSTTTLAPPAARLGRAPSRKVDPSKILSPKSHNSRQLPHSPIRAPTSPGKSYLARPVSPVKPTTSAQTATASLASMVGMAESSRKGPGRPTKQVMTNASTGTLRGKRAPTATGPPVPPKHGRNRAISSSSDNSNTSTGTTVVTKKAAPVKKGIMSKMSGMASSAGKRATAKKEIPAPSSAGTGGRVLRARR
jgi:hypothetical protein